MHRELENGKTVQTCGLGKTGRKELARIGGESDSAILQHSHVTKLECRCLFTQDSDFTSLTISFMALQCA